MKILNKLNTIKKNRLSISNYKITNNWLVGFTEAEGSFIGTKGKQPSFQLSQHAADYTLMEAIAKFIGKGEIRVNKREDGRTQAILVIYDKIVLRERIIPIFTNKFLLKKKTIQFNQWKKDHFNIESSENNLLNNKIDPEWLVGFTDGDGSFYPMIHKAKDYKSGYQVQLVYDIAQIEEEKELLNEISNQYFNNTHKWGKSGRTEHMRISKVSALKDFVEPFFIKHQLQSRKIYDFVIWQEILEKIKNKEHLTIEGVNNIRELVKLQKEFRLKIN